MTTLYWEGRADTVAQVATAEFGTYDATTTRTITIGGVAVDKLDTGGTLTAALSAFATTLNASTHPYFAAITWTSSATKITGTADTAGVPFVFVGSVTGGTGTLVDGYTVTTASAGPNDWSTAANWDTGAIPVNSDDVIIQDSDVNIMWGLDQNGVSLTSLTIKKTFTGKIGLDYTQFATSADGETFSATEKPEYRQGYLKIISTTVNIGEHFGPSSPAGSGRIRLDLHTTASTCTIHGSAGSPTDTGRGAVQVLANNSSTDIFVRNCPGGLDVAMGVPGETSTVRKVSVGSDAGASPVRIGKGTTITTYEQFSGTGSLNAAATVTTVTCDGGELTTEGSYVVTTGNSNGGTIYANHISGTVSFTTLNISGGTVNARRSTQARTWTTVNFKDGTLEADSTVLTITALNEGDSGIYSMSISRL